MLEINMELKSVSKGRFLSTLTCPLMGWGLRHGLIKSIPEDDYFSKFLATQGHIVGDYSTAAWDNYLASNGFDPKIASVNVDEELDKRNITREDPKEWLDVSVQITKDAMSDRQVLAIYEATVHVDSYTTRADILYRVDANHDWKMIELKSITSFDNFTARPSNYRDSRYKYLDDMAYTCMVFRHAGISLEGAYLLNVNKSCNEENLKITINSPQHNAFFNMSTEFSQAVMDRSLKFDDCWDYVRDVTSSNTPPLVDFDLSCKKCQMCASYLDTKNNNYIFDIPFAGAGGPLKRKLQRLISSNRFKLEQIPTRFFDEFKINGRENLREQTAAVVTECTKSNRSYMRATSLDCDDGGLPRLLSTPLDSLGITWPVVYLDFEFLGTAVPLWKEVRDEDGSVIQPGVRPYEAVPVQYSFHVSMNTGEPPLHIPDEPIIEKSFIALPGKDMRLKMAIQLATDLRESSLQMGVKLEDMTFMVWHQTAELSCLNYFIGGTTKYPDPLPWLPLWAVETLQIVRDNIVDLLNIVRGGKVSTAVPGFKTKLNYYHPAFKGSFSLKNVVKMLSGDNPYEASEIGSGAEAFAKYGELSYAFTDKAPNFWNIDSYLPEEIGEILTALDSYCKEDTYSLFRIHEKLAEEALIFLSGKSNILRWEDIPFSGETVLALPAIVRHLPDVFN